MYAVSVAVHLGLGAFTASALANSAIVTNSFIAFGTGVAAAVLVKKAGSYAVAALPSGEDNSAEIEPAGSPTRTSRGDNDGS